MLIFGVSVSGLSGCQSSEQSPGQSLEERIVARWNHFVERDFAAAWDYYSPGFRQTTPRDEFASDMERRPLRWRGVELIDVSCEGDLCTAKLAITYQALGAPSGLGRLEVTSQQEERWIRIEGDWWFVTN